MTPRRRGQGLGPLVRARSPGGPRQGRRVLGVHSQFARRTARAGVRLSDHVVSARTVGRYTRAVGRFFDWLRLEGHELADDTWLADDQLCAFLEDLWENGDPKSWAGDAISGLQYYVPPLRRHLHSSWRLFEAWGRLELPARAPPLSEPILLGIVGRAFSSGSRELLVLGVLCLIGFYGFLRTGELLGLAPADIMVNADASDLAVGLAHTKSGARTGTMESVRIPSEVTAIWVHHLLELRQLEQYSGGTLWSAGSGVFRRRFQELLTACGLGEFGFKPYSLRRGGATWAFRVGRPLEEILLRGRWKHSRVARLYIVDGLASMTAMRLPPHVHQSLAQHARYATA